jgi:hypothetical protein
VNSALSHPLRNMQVAKFTLVRRRQRRNSRSVADYLLARPVQSAPYRFDTGIQLAQIFEDRNE